jgi:alkylated DNA repair dioxygenase AlkB
MRDLFDMPVLPGLRLQDDIVSPEEETELIARIDACDPAPFRFQGWEGKRRTVSFGWSYDFETAQLDAAPPMPEWLFALRDRAASFANLTPGALVHALLTRYDPGAGIGWHRDRPAFAHVVGISLGAAATMRFRRRDGRRFVRAAAPLTPRGVYHLSGEARYAWEHSIVELAQTRWSITFRSLASA